MNRNLQLAAVVVALTLPVGADAALSRTDDASVSFTASGPGGLKIVGSTSELTLADDPKALTVTVPLAQLSTGIGLRDAHMRDKYLHVSSFPTAALLVTRTDLKLPAAGGQLDGDANGTMTLHGQSHPVAFHYSARHEGAKYLVTGAVRINMKDYGIEVPSYLGVGVKPEVDVTVRFSAKDDT